MARGLRRLKSSTSELSPYRKRLLLLEQILRQWQTWRAFYEDEGLMSITIQGEEWHFLDLLRGIESLPPKQKQALWLLLVEDIKQVEVARIMMPWSPWSTPVAQYKDLALRKLLDIHDGRVSAGQLARVKRKKVPKQSSSRSGARRSRASSIGQSSHSNVLAAPGEGTPGRRFRSRIRGEQDPVGGSSGSNEAQRDEGTGLSESLPTLSEAS